MTCQLLYLLLLINGVLSLRCQKASPSNCIYNLTCSYRTIECQSSSSPSQVRGGMYCTSIVKKENQQILVGSMDCIYDQEMTKKCFNQTQCIMKYTTDQKQFLHCCCDQHLCNLNFNLSDPEPVQLVNNRVIDGECEGVLCRRTTYWLLVISLCVFIVVIVLLVCLLARRQIVQNLKNCRNAQKNNNADGSHSNPVEREPLLDDKHQIDSSSIVVEQLFKRGRFSQIERASLKNECVALKSFCNDPQSKVLFTNEKEIYSLLTNKHRNILEYFGFTINPTMRLVLEFCPSGSLKEYLNSNLIGNEKQLLTMFSGIAEAVHFLHKDFRSASANRRAPIAHRDVKSENILVFNPSRVVICDFALSTQIQQYQHGQHAQQQVGTPRYMSPEILVGTIGCEEGSLLKCDVYALGIVLWELLSRFDFQLSHVNKYKLPFEDQLIECKLNVNNPTVKDMLEIIHLPQPKNRPLIDSQWDNSTLKSFHSILSILNECWNHNPDLRIQAGVVFNRIHSILSTNSYN